MRFLRAWLRYTGRLLLRDLFQLGRVLAALTFIALVGLAVWGAWWLFDRIHGAVGGP